MLGQRAAVTDVDELQPAADAEHGQASFASLLEERQFHFVALAARILRLMIRLAIVFRIYVSAAAQDETGIGDER
jgi:hypothetical protein